MTEKKIIFYKFDSNAKTWEIAFCEIKTLKFILLENIRRDLNSFFFLIIINFNLTTQS